MARAVLQQRQGVGGERARALSTRAYSPLSLRYGTLRQFRPWPVVVDQMRKITLGGRGRMITQAPGTMFLTLARKALCEGPPKDLGRDDAQRSRVGRCKKTSFQLLTAPSLVTASGACRYVVDKHGILRSRPSLSRRNILLASVFRQSEANQWR